MIELTPCHSSHVIEWHLKEIQANRSERLVFFYCSRKEVHRTSPLDIFRSLVAQLALSPDGSSVAESIKRKHKEKKQDELDNPDLLVGLLTGLIALYQRTTIVVDALDECEDYGRLLRLLKKVSNGTRGAIKFFFSSRTNVKLLKDFPSWEKLELDSEKGLTKDDINTYIRTQVKDREKMDLGPRLLDEGRSMLGESLVEALEDRLIETLTRRAQGM